MKRIFILLILSICMLGCNKTVTKKEMDFFYMDTYINIKVYNKVSDDILIKCENIFSKYHELTDRYNAYDNIKNIYYINNNLKINEKMEIDADLYDLLKFGKEIFTLTNGVVNIGLGNVIDVWNEYKNDKIGIPTYNELIKSGSINLDDIILLDNNTIMKKSDIKLDLGSIAKGYTSEKVAIYLKEMGANKYIINAGGNVLVGEHYNNKKYVIGIADPNDSSLIFDKVKVTSASVVTSGSYERYFVFNGKEYNHIINPKTLFPSENDLSVTVITKNSAYADAMSTYLFILPVEEALDYVNSHDNIEAIWYLNNKEIIRSNGFGNYEQE